MPESVGPIRKIIRATREVTVTINGEEYDALLLPKNAMAEVDFSDYPEDDPLRRQVNIEKMSTVELHDEDLSRSGQDSWTLTKRGAYRLLESL